MEKLEVKAEVSIDDAGTISGVAWPFGTPDSVGDIIEKGAFSFPAALPVILEHDQSKVVGVWERAEQTDTGLEVKGRLFIEGVRPSREAHELMKSRRINGLSIGFKADAFEALPSGGRRFSAVTLTEISLSRRPVHPGARITSVKSNPEGNPLDPETTEDAALELKAANDSIAKLTARLDKIEAKANRPTAANDNHPRAANDNERKAFADFIRSGDVTEVKSLGHGAPSTGGILAPEQVATSILEKVAEFSPVRSLAQTISMSGPLLQLPRLVDEVDPVPVTEPTFESRVQIHQEPSLPAVENSQRGPEGKRYDQLARRVWSMTDVQRSDQQSLAMC